MKKIIVFTISILFVKISFGQSYKNQLDSLNQFLKTFNEGVYGYFEVIDKDIYIRFKSGTFSMASINHIDKAYVDPDNKTVYLKCKNDSNCMLATYLGYNIVGTYMSDHKNPNPNTRKFAQLINVFLDAVRASLGIENNISNNKSASNEPGTTFVNNQKSNENSEVNTNNKFKELKYVGCYMIFVSNTTFTTHIYSFEVYGVPGSVLEDKDKLNIRKKAQTKINEINKNRFKEQHYYEIKDEYFYVNRTEKETIKSINDQLESKNQKPIDKITYNQGKYTLVDNSDFPVYFSDPTGMSNTKITTIANGFYEINEASFLQDQLFILNETLYRFNKHNNKIEKIDIAANSITPIVEFAKGEILARAVATNQFIYYATKEDKEYVIYKYDVKSKQSSKIAINDSGKINKLNHFENNIIGEQKRSTFIDLKLVNNSLIIRYGTFIRFLNDYNHKGSLIKLYSILENKNEALYIDKEESDQYEIYGKMKYYEHSVDFCFKNNKIIKSHSITQSKTGGGYDKTRFIEFGEYKADKNLYELNRYSFDFPINYVDKIFEYNNRVFLICSFEESPGSEVISRVFYEFTGTKQIQPIEVIGTGINTNYCESICTDNKIYIESFNKIYKYDLTDNSLNEMVSFDSNTSIRNMEITPLGNIVFTKKTADKNSKNEYLFYNSGMNKTLDLTSFSTTNGDDLGTSGISYSLATAKNNDYFFKYNKSYKGHLYKFDFQNNSAKLISPPDFGESKYSLVQNRIKLPNSPFICLEIEYYNKKVKEVKYLIYKCE